MTSNGLVQLAATVVQRRMLTIVQRLVTHGLVRAVVQWLGARCCAAIRYRQRAARGCTMVDQCSLLYNDAVVRHQNSSETLTGSDAPSANSGKSGRTLAGLQSRAGREADRNPLSFQYNQEGTIKGS